ncbi:MAG: CRTAC1 family protein [Thermoanaerobaculia bacterium]|nr:CRTAC1 family protein [Thermoanaerobaculia bacterium]
MTSDRLRDAAAATLALLALAACGREATSDPTRAPLSADPVYVPALDPDAPTLADLAEAQAAAAAETTVLRDFSFADVRSESGIDFRNQVVDDLKRDLKPVHYDHGNGVAIADVDGDGLTDIYFTTQLGPNQLWRNLGDGRFENRTDATLAVEDRISVAASFADIDNDGDADLYVTTVRMGNLLLENDGTGRFADISAAAGVDYVGHSSGSVFFDFDLDGRLDLLVANVGTYTTDARGAGGYYVGLDDAFSGQLYPERYERSRLYRNLGDNRFEDVTETVGLDDPSWTGDASAVDLTGDRYPDLYLLDMQGHDEYWENVGGQTFRRRSREVFPRTPWGAMGIKFFDWDNDLDLDLFLTDMHSDMSENIGPEREKLKANMQWPEETLRSEGLSIWGNAFYENRGDGDFEEISDRIGAENYWPWGLSVGDLNADGFEDAFLASSMSYPYRYGPNSVLLNDGGRGFVEAAFLLGVEPRRDGTTYIPWFDLDCAGDDQRHELCRGHVGPITVWGTLGSRSSAIFDLDRDGDLDIVTNEFGHYPQVLRSDLAQRHPVRWLEVELVGTTSNRDGLGASVTLQADGKTQLRVNDGKSGYLSQSDQPLYVGLGEADSVDSIHVLWPSGREQRVEGGIAVGTRLTLEEPEPIS